MLSNLSTALREEIFYEDKGSVLKKIPLFSSNFSDRLIKRLSQQVKEVQYSPGDVIDSAELKTISDKSLCYVYRGRVQLFTRCSHSKLYRGEQKLVAYSSLPCPPSSSRKSARTLISASTTSSWAQRAARLTSSQLTSRSSTACAATTSLLSSATRSTRRISMRFAC